MTVMTCDSYSEVRDISSYANILNQHIDEIIEKVKCTTAK